MIMAVTSTIQYLKRDEVHDTEKPYHLYYDPKFNFPRTNTTPDYQNVAIRNAGELDDSSVDMFTNYGFAKMQLRSQLRPEDHLNSAKLESLLFPEYTSIARSLFPNLKKTGILEHTVRKRDPTWDPTDGRERYEFSTNQPSDYVHIDMTSSSAEKSAMKKFGIHPDQFEKFIVLNFWKPIKGPVYDWPLTLCDRRTIDYSSQCIPTDVVTEKYVNENTRIYFDPVHQWYFFDGLRTDEVIVFMQSDSSAKDSRGVPHTSFQNPQAPAGSEPRQSIEVRMYVYF